MGTAMSHIQRFSHGLDPKRPFDFSRITSRLGSFDLGTPTGKWLHCHPRFSRRYPPLPGVATSVHFEWSRQPREPRVTRYVFVSESNPGMKSRHTSALRCTTTPSTRINWGASRRASSGTGVSALVEPAKHFSATKQTMTEKKRDTKGAPAGSAGTLDRLAGRRPLRRRSFALNVGVRYYTALRRGDIMPRWCPGAQRTMAL